MTVQVTLKMVGGKELAKELHTYPHYVQEEVLRDAVLAGGLILVGAIKDEARAKHVLLTGTLIRSYHIGGHTELTPEWSGGTDYGDIHGEAVGAHFYQIMIGTNLVYARRQEFGFVGKDSLGRTYAQPPRSHLRVAFDTQQKAVAEEIQDTIRAKLLARRSAA